MCDTPPKVLRDTEFGEFTPVIADLLEDVETEALVAAAERSFLTIDPAASTEGDDE